MFLIVPDCSLGLLQNLVEGEARIRGVASSFVGFGLISLAVCGFGIDKGGDDIHPFVSDFERKKSQVQRIGSSRSELNRRNTGRMLVFFFPPVKGPS